ncbi:9763_t:CDS:2, partial [Rhizophagus irregularis]
KEVSDMMRQRNREKKLLRGSTYSSQDQDKLSIFQNNSSMPLEDSVETETNTSITQDFIQKVSSELIDEDDVQVIDGNQELTTDMIIEVELAHLFLEISCCYSYGKRFEESVQEIIARDNVSDQTARKQLFQDIIKHLSGITLETLC